MPGMGIHIMYGVVHNVFYKSLSNYYPSHGHQLNYFFELMTMSTGRDQYFEVSKKREHKMTEFRFVKPTTPSDSIIFLNSSPPQVDEIKTSLTGLHQLCESEASLLDVLERMSIYASNTWIRATFVLAREYVLQDNKTRELPTAERYGQLLPTGIPEGFIEFANRYLKARIEPLISNYFHLGTNWASHTAVCCANSPSSLEMAQAWKTLGVMIRSGIPILDSLKAVGESTKHPWILMIFDMAYQFTISSRDIKDTLASGIRNRLLKFTQNRFNRMSNLSKGSLEDCYLPNFLEFFNTDLNMLDVGEETGEIASSLITLASMHQTNASLSSTQPVLSLEMQNFLSRFSAFYKRGLPVLRALKILEKDPFCQSLRPQIKKICDEIECGNTLSEAFSQAGGEFSNPILIEVIKASEEGRDLGEMINQLLSI